MCRDIQIYTHDLFLNPVYYVFEDDSSPLLANHKTKAFMIIKLNQLPYSNENEKKVKF